MKTKFAISCKNENQMNKSRHKQGRCKGAASHVYSAPSNSFTASVSLKKAFFAHSSLADARFSPFSSIGIPNR